jgi:hypothetical protein
LDWIAAAASPIAAVGLAFTGYQVWVLNRQARDDRRVVLEGVAVSWHPVEAPSVAEQPDGTSTWRYTVVLTNPGRLPIDDIQIRWVFPVPVVRKRHGGVRDAAATELVLSAPVLPGGAQRTWNRWLLMPFEHKQRLVDTYAEVTFTDMNGVQRTNRWPRQVRRPLPSGSSGT